MKKTLLGIACLLACTLSIKAQLLYGLTPNGLTEGAGVINELIANTNTLTIEKNFKNGVLRGSSPAGAMVLAGDGKLYGTTTYGGNFSFGVLFSFDPSSSTFAKVKDFDNTSTGSFPYGSLVLASDGKLYGMTSTGGPAFSGTIYSFDPSDSVFSVLKNFGVDGDNPRGSLMQASDGKLYGMTTSGGIGYGSIFSFEPSSSTFTMLKSFDGHADGGLPFGNFVQAGNGKLYGLAVNGGINNGGVIFSYDILTSTYTAVRQFDQAGGNWPFGSLIRASDGKLYGMTSKGGLSDSGTIFSFDPSTSTYMNLKDFEGKDGAGPTGNLMQASDGKLYGMTRNGGSNNYGVIFSFEPSTSTYTKLQDYKGANGANPYLGSGFVEVVQCPTSVQYYKDADGDGYGNPYNFKIAREQPAGYVTNNKDCDDSNKAMHSITYYRDADGDGFGDANASITTCDQVAPAGYAKNKNDDDDRSKITYKVSSYPNPFKETSVIKYMLPFDSKVSVKVYNLSGKAVATLVNGDKKAGFYTVNFNAGRLSSGILYYRITATSKDQHFEKTGKMVLLR